MKCVSYTRTLPWKNYQSKLTIAEQNQRIAAYLAEHKELDLQKKYSDRKNDEKARTASENLIALLWHPCITVGRISRRYGRQSRKRSMQRAST